MSAEIPKLHRRLPLGAPGAFGDRPPAEAIVVLADPAVPRALSTSPPSSGEPACVERWEAFPVLSRFDIV